MANKGKMEGFINTAFVGTHFDSHDAGNTNSHHEGWLFVPAAPVI